VLLAEAAMQVLEGEGAAVLVCDARLRVVAANAKARESAWIDDATAFLTEEIRAPILERVASLEEGASPTLRMRVAHGADTVAVRARRLEGSNGIAVALVLEPGHAATPPLRTALSALELSVRERQLVELLRHGQSNRQIAMRLRLTEGTVKSYLHELFRKLDVDSRMQLVARVEELVHRVMG
jgi:DNA-binding NarL/FixJ family response regulator